MALGNLVVIRVHYLLIKWIVCFSRRDEFFMMSFLVCMVTHWTRPMVNHDVRLLVVMIHQATILHALSTLREY